MKYTKRLFAMLLAVMLVLALAAPALADGETTYTVTIQSPDNSNDHQFTAYQIFSGTVSSANTLTDVKWGTNINPDKTSDLITALKAISISSGTPFTSMTQDTAASVADILSANKDNADLIQEFQQVILNKTDGAYTYLTGDGTSIAHSESSNDGTYTADNVASGYYVVVDGADTNKSGIIMQVISNTDITAKISVPDVTKYAGEQAVTDNAQYAVGDEIPYTLIGTTPNFSENGYTYKFTDTMDAALDLNYTPSAANAEQVEDGVKVTIGAGEGATDITNKFQITYVANADGSHTLTIASNQDLKDSGLSDDSSIYVTYTAQVNSTVQGSTTITNRVKVESQMGTDDQTETQTKTEQVYPITIEITKVDGADNNTKLAGVEFQLTRTKDATTEYATTNADGKFAGWTTTEADAATFTTDTNGQINIVGVGAGTFTLTETKPIQGYNSLDPISITIQSESTQDSTGTLKLSKLAYSMNGGAMTSVSDNDLTRGVVALTIENNKGAELPSTGGIGTTIFYVVGAVLVIGAVVVLVTRKRMNQE